MCVQGGHVYSLARGFSRQGETARAALREGFSVKNIFYAPLVVLGLLAAPICARAYTQGFEAADPQFFQQPMNGVSSDGTAADVSTEHPHSGKRSAHLAYRFSKRGGVNLVLLDNPVVATQGDGLSLSLWIYGCGQNDFPGGGGLVLVDDGGETFQFNLGKPMADALDGAGWTQLKAGINLSKPDVHWGGKNTGVIKFPVKFLGFGLDHWPDQAASGDVYFDDIIIKSSAPRQANLSMQGDSKLDLAVRGAAPGFFKLWAPVTVDFHSSGMPEGSAVKWKAVDFHGVQTANGSVAPSLNGNGSFTIVPKASGILYVHADMIGGDGSAAATAETRFAAYASSPAAAVRQGSSLPLLFGVNTHMERLSPAGAETEMQWVSALGFGLTRIGTSWDAMEPQKGVWNWSTSDRLVGLLKKYSIEPQWLLAYTAKWAATGDLNAADWTVWGNSPPNFDDFGAYARATASRYKSTVHYWEVWNEPDNGFWRGTPEQYAQLFDAAYTGVKAADPSAVVMNGGISEVGHPGFVSTWQGAIHNKPDIFAYHSHAPLTGMIRAHSAIEADMKAVNWTMPVWNNEAGFSSVGGVTEQEQAITLAKKISYAAALGNKAYFWYDLVNDGNDPTNNEFNFGLIREDHSPKASAVAARALIDSLRGYRFLRRIDFKQNPDIYALLFGTEDSKAGVMVLWNEARTSVPLLFKVPGKSQKTSLMGNIEPLRNNAGLVALTASNEPQYVSFSGSASQIGVAPPALGVSNQLIVAPGETAQVKIDVTNPLPGPLKGTVSVNPPPGWRAVKPSLAVDLAVGGHKQFMVDITAPPNPALHDTLTVKLTAAALPAAIQGSALLSGAVAIPRVNADPVKLGETGNWTTPVVTLERGNLVSIYQNAPLDNMLFHGDEDLSAKVYVSDVPSGLRLSVLVHDDVFNQNEAAGFEWKGDSLQFAVVLPGGQNYEWTAALTPSGPSAHLDIAPAGEHPGSVNFPLAIRRDEAVKETIYDLIIPETLPGGVKLGKRLCMTLLCNDNDGGGRKGWVEWTPGIGMTKAPSQYQPIVIR